MLIRSKSTILLVSLKPFCTISILFIVDDKIKHHDSIQQFNKTKLANLASRQKQAPVNYKSITKPSKNVSAVKKSPNRTSRAERNKRMSQSRERFNGAQSA